MTTDDLMTNNGQRGEVEYAESSQVGGGSSHRNAGNGPRESTGCRGMVGAPFHSAPLTDIFGAAAVGDAAAPRYVPTHHEAELVRRWRRWRGVWE